LPVIDPQRDVIDDRHRPKSFGEITQFNRRQLTAPCSFFAHSAATRSTRQAET